MPEFAVSHIKLEDIDILAEKIQALSKSMMVTDLADFESQGSVLLHHDCFIIFNRSASNIREKLKEIENGKGVEATESTDTAEQAA